MFRLAGMLSLVLVVALGSTHARAEAPAAAQEFRIETDVYMGDEPDVISHTVTLFEKSAVYEFVDDPEQVVVYRTGDSQRAAQFILLDPKSQRRTEVDVDRVRKLMTKLNQWAAEQKDPLLKFAADPKFEETFDRETGDLTLSSKEWTYHVATVPADNPAALTRYRDFTDRYAELATMLHGAAPPAPRQALDAALEKHKAAPVEIRRVTGGDDKNAVRAAHLFSWRLSRDDRAKIEEAQRRLASFEKVDNKNFLTALRHPERAKEVVRGQSQ